MTQDELLRAFHERGYTKEQFSLFQNEFNSNMDIDGTISEPEAFKRSCIYIEKYNEQKQLGFSDKWAHDFAENAEFGDDDYEFFLDYVDRQLESDVRLCAHLQHKGQLYEDIFIEAYTRGDSPFRVTERKMRIYNELIAEGQSAIYAEAYLDALDENDDEPDIYAQAVDEAVENGYDKEEAHNFAATCSLRYDFAEDRIPNTIKNLSKYNSEWQRHYIFHWLAIKLASGNFIRYENDFCNIFERECNFLDQEVSEDELLEVLETTLEEYSINHPDDMKIK